MAEDKRKLAQKFIARNKKALHDYEIIDTMEAGIVLEGAEVKSIRLGHVTLAESFAVCSRGEVWLNNVNINQYSQAGMFLPDPIRRRKLLLNKSQIVRLASEVERKKLTLIPLSMYFKKHWVKVELALCRGRKNYDKRHAIADKETKVRLASIMKNARR
jgi:SsrA-binding protein